MKKNLLSIIILVLLLANIALTAIMMFNVTSTNKKVASLVTDIATVLKLDLTVPGEEQKKEPVSLADTEIYALNGSMTLALTPETVTDPNGNTSSRQGYFVCSMSFSIDKKHEDYKEYGTAEAMASREALIKDAIGTVVSRHTTAELQADAGLENLKAEILNALHELFQSDFIYKVSISDVKYG